MNGIVLLVVAIIILVIIAYLLGIIIRKKNDGLISELENRKKTLFELPVNEEIETVKNLHLIGQSQTSFRDWSQKWTEISLTSFSEIENQIFEAENFNDTFNFIRAKNEIKQIQEKLNTVEIEISAIRAGLSDLSEQEEKNSSRVTYALDLYEKLQNDIEANSDGYGPAMPEINKQLLTIQSEFSQFVTLNSSGDPVEASEVLERAEEHTIALGQITEKVIPLVKELDDNFPNQLEDLESGYAKLLEENYYFSDSDVEVGFQKIRESISDASDDLASLELAKVEVDCRSIQESLDKFYHLFEREISAHKEVKKASQRLPKYLEHVTVNNTALREELNRLTQRYIFSDTIGNKLSIFSSNLESLAEELAIITKVIDEPEKPFSELQRVFEKLNSQISDVEEGQLVIFEQLQGTETGEEKANHKLDDYINRLHMIKRFVEKRNLPGIPQDFMSHFFTTSSQLEALKAELGRNRVDMSVVEQLLEVSTSAISSLENVTYQLIQDAVLTEQLLQYSNRYRSFDQNVQESYERTLNLFQMDYNYKASFDDISYALELVEPGVTDRFVSSYEKSRELIRF